LEAHQLQEFLYSNLIFAADGFVAWEKTVIPAKAGIHRSADEAVEKWIPAFAGMTG